ncbi:HAMP domain-containing sensor histidine kinase [Aureisphaera galaxeae]|uniref:sensor histidine kinase n=1 Tax=Aureisphaera galaxeae TaxID=1538023 RepID=UPI0023509A3D|nr:HAMP domain-containing sensor histidine kinase [Aureisphaera galaxeae]MDC8003321.1 HAMP domain-containing sensor histidine kinase [Aureisphaera galaxeae]
MNALQYKGILYFITSVIVATFCIQVYWNYKNYTSSKQQLINDVQTSLDNSIDQYFTGLAVENSFEFIGLEPPFHDLIKRDSNPNVHIKGGKTFVLRDTSHIKIDTLQYKDTLGGSITILKTNWDDSLKMDIEYGAQWDSIKLNPAIRETFTATLDVNSVSALSNKIMVSFSEESLSLPKIDSLFLEELDRKNISMDYGLTYKNIFGKQDTLRSVEVEKASLSTLSQSPYFLHNDDLQAHFSNITLAVLKKNTFGLLLSFMLMAAVIGCLLYLLKIIQQQKQLAEVKNDLIGNITHEFKTPIATIGVAMEAIQNFSSEEDREKNLRYAKISSEQVDKLNVMVEKLLETATLDSEKLELNPEPSNLVELLRKASQKELFSNVPKEITFQSNEDTIIHAVDAFHFENAINNIIDNAIKYGGDRIQVSIEKGKGAIEIIISDSGNSLTEAHKKQLFEKFYRVPKGNTHDVKGFGIGLYYTKTIIEKHGGTIQLQIKPNTAFKISLPHG